MTLNKVCPFISTPDNHTTCIGEKCVLYDVETNDCAIFTILSFIDPERETN